VTEYNVPLGMHSTERVTNCYVAMSQTISLGAEQGLATWDYCW